MNPPFASYSSLLNSRVLKAPKPSILSLFLNAHKKMAVSKVLQIPKVSEDFIIVVLGVLLSLEVASLYIFYQVINDDDQ
jgi:hypothetical protein